MSCRGGFGALAALALTCGLLSGASQGALAQTPVKFTLDWRFEGPAAPFTVALDKGYFKAEGLDVTIDTGAARASRSRGWRPAPTTSAPAT